MAHKEGPNNIYMRTSVPQPILGSPELDSGSPRKLPKHVQQQQAYGHASSPQDTVHVSRSPRKLPKHVQHLQAYGHASSPRAAGGGRGLLRKWWFWAALGLAAAVIAVVVAVALRFGPLAALSSEGVVSLDFDLNTEGPRPAVRLQGSQLVRAADGKPVNIHGVNWFGFNNLNTMVDGLGFSQPATWEGSNFATIVQTLKLLGFNAVRLPFQFTDLFTVKPRSFEMPCPGTPPTAASLAARTTAPGASTNGRPAPALPPLPPGSRPGMCNSYLPNGPTTLDRYVWVVKHFIEQGFWVLCDYHTHEDEPALESPAQLVQNWLRLWKAMTALPAWDEEMKGRVFLDLLNEPDEHKLGWDGPLPGGTRTAALADYYLAVMDALYAEEPGSTLFFIQGGGQSALGTSWGDGFVTDKAWIQQRGLSDANPFFQALSTKPYRNQVVLAPHLYGVSVTRSPDVGTTEWQKFEVSWGHMMSPGYCSTPSDPASCQKYPVVAGEIGTSFQNPLDLQYYDDMARFFNQTPPADTYKSAPVNNWFWWAYNQNSGDTGGLVGSDWETLNWTKLKWLQDNLGLKAWYM